MKKVFSASNSLLYVLSLLLIACLSGCESIQTANETVKQPVKESWLFTMSAPSGSILHTSKEGQTCTITMDNVSPLVTRFTDMPVRKMDVIPTETFFRDWSKIFPKDNPNGAFIAVIDTASGSKEAESAACRIVGASYDKNSRRVTFTFTHLSNSVWYDAGKIDTNIKESLLKKTLTITAFIDSASYEVSDADKQAPVPPVSFDSPLKIAAFKDITAFVLETGKSENRFNIDVQYVKDADEAHNALNNPDVTARKDIVFMSYDDTLSMALLDKNSDIEAVMPIHGGILDLCGSIDIAQGKTKIGIDTNSGYARALRFYLKNTYLSSYDELQWLMIGATNLRYEKLKKGDVDTTLLNPPYSYLLSSEFSKVRMYNEVGAYQGVVVNVNKSWLKDKVNLDRLKYFSNSYYFYINDLKSNKNKTIASLIDYYNQNNINLTVPEAEAIFDRLWEQDGLNQSSQFDKAQLEGTENLFNWDTKVTPPKTWIGNINEL
jgi:hypothetical protein